MFITFEGLDFSGKSTQAERLVERMQRSTGKTVHFLREPGGTGISERVRELLLDKRNLAMCDITELLLFAAARAQLVQEVIRPALARGEIVVCDRFLDSTSAYQGFGRGIARETTDGINNAAIGSTIPDVTILINIPVSEIMVRKERAGIAFDRMESSGVEFYERVSRGYLVIAEREPKRVQVVDGRGPVEQVAEAVWEIVERLM